MSDPRPTPPDPQNSHGTLAHEPVPYQPPEKKNQVKHVGCLILSMLLACFVAFLCFIAFMSMTQGHHALAVIFASGIILLVFGGIVASQFGVSAALAVALVSVCAFILMIGLCSQVPIVMH